MCMARDLSRREFLRKGATAALGFAGLAGCSRDSNSIFNPYSSSADVLKQYADKYIPGVASLCNAAEKKEPYSSGLETLAREMYSEAKAIQTEYGSDDGFKVKYSSSPGLASATKSGDVDGNDSVNIFDLLEILKVLSGRKPATAASDVNKDGYTNIFDLLSLLQRLADPDADWDGPSIDVYLDDQLLETPVALQKDSNSHFQLKVEVYDEKSGVEYYKTMVTLEDGTSQEFENLPEIDLPAIPGAYDILVEATDVSGNKSTLERTFTSVPLDAFYGQITETLSGQRLSDLEVELTMPNGAKHTTQTNHMGAYSFDVPSTPGYSTIKIPGHQDGHEPMYNYENSWVELDKTSSENVQMIREAEDPDNPGYDLLEHLKWVNGDGGSPGWQMIRWHDDAYPLKVFWDRENAPSDKLVDLLKGGWDLWEEAINEQIAPDFYIPSLFEEVDEMPEMGIYCTWDCDRFAEFYFDEWHPQTNPEHYLKGRVEWNPSINDNINLPGVEPGYAALGAHEFGHALIVSNSPKRNHIMYAGFTTEETLKPAAFEALTAAVIYRLKSGTILLNYSKEG